MVGFPPQGTGAAPEIINKGRVWIAHGSNVITLSTAQANANYRSEGTIHLPAMGGVTTRGPTHTNPMTITTIPDPNDATNKRLVVRLHGGFGFSSCGATGPLVDTATGATERYDDVANTHTARAAASARARVAGYSLNGFGFVSGGLDSGDNAVTTVERFDDVVNAHVARTGLTTGRLALAGYSLNGYGFTSCGMNFEFTIKYGATERFDDAANTHTARADATARSTDGYSLNNYGFTSGGNTQSGDVSQTGLTERFDDSANSHTARTSITARRNIAEYAMSGYGFTSCGLIGGSVSGVVEKLDDVANTQTARTSATARMAVAGYGLNGFGFTSGGSTNATGSAPSAVTERFDDIANTHTARTGLTTARFGAAGYSTNEYFVNFMTVDA